ncbi:MAG TPA: SURF1 family cytochrome oxidase biogenesis protein [Aldersonia sp.]
MRRLRFLLRPSWVILVVLVGAFAYLCFTVLAPWQLGKNNSTEHRNDLIAASVDADPVPVADLLGPDGADPAHEWRRVTATGTYVPGSTVLVRLRSIEGAPSYEALAAFRLDDGRTVLIDRGYVGAVDGTKPPEITPPPTEPVTVSARVRASEPTVPGKDSIVDDGYRQVYFVDSGQVGGVLALDLVPGYLQLEAGVPGAFEPIPLPQLDAGPYLSYGLQWLAFGIMAPLGLAYFVRAELRERRREKRPASAPEPVPMTTEQKLADRYGKNR